MFRVLLDIFLIYLAYQFIFNFIVPLFKTTQQVKKGFRAMHDRMNETVNNNQNSQPQQPQSNKAGSSSPIGDYIDFEEVK